MAAGDPFDEACACVTVPAVGSLPSSAAASNSLYLVDVLNQVLVGAYSGRYARVYDLQTSAVIRTITLDASGQYLSYAWVKPGVMFCACAATGETRLVDYLQGEVIETGYIEPFFAATFDCDLQVIAAIGADYTMNIYVLEAVPAQLSNPAATPAPAPATVSDVSVRLLGADGEAVSGYWVVWALTGLGSLQHQVSRTDEDGYAANKYFGPLSGIGDITIACEVTV